MSPVPPLTTPAFDLEILLPVHPEGRYLRRLEAFQRFGFLGGHDHRIRLVLLPGSYHLDPIFHSADAWDGITEVVVVPGPHDHPAPKIAHYYSSVMAQEPLLARWYLRVDDDSLTDLDRLMRYLDTTLDWRDILHISGTMTWDMIEPYAQALRALDGERFFQDQGFCQIFHEWEASITSASAMKRILGDGRAVDLLRMVSQVPYGFGDQCLPLAARLCGILLSQVPLMTTHCQLDEFATFAPEGHGLFHIHYLSPDNEEMWRRYMEKRREVGLPVEEDAPVPVAAGHHYEEDEKR